MTNQDILIYMSEKSAIILKQEGTCNHDVYEKLYPLLQFVERIRDITQGLSKLFDNGEPHACWPILMRPLMLDGVYSTSALAKLIKNEDHNEIFYNMLSDGLAKIITHANKQAGWGVITKEEAIQAIAEFKANFGKFFNEDGSTKYPAGKRTITPVVLVEDLFANKIMYFNPAQDFYTRYIILSKHEHYNVLNTEFSKKLNITGYIKMSYIHLMYIIDIIISIDGAVTSRAFRKEMYEVGIEIAPEYIS